MTTLKQARDHGNLREFLQERQNNPDGDEAAFNRLFESMAGKSKAVPATSKPDAPAD